MEHKNIQSIFSLEDNEAAEVKRIKRLIAENVNFNIQSTGERSVFVQPVASADVLESYAIANLASNLDWSLLMYETFKGYAKAVKLLLNPKSNINVNVNLTDNMNWTALMIAACKGHAQIAKTLMNAKSHVNTKAENGETALIFAATFGHAKVAEVLLEDKKNVDKADVNETRNDKRTALMFAAIKGHDKVVEILLGANADITMKDNYDKTALNYAATSKVAQLLKKHINDYHPAARLH